MISVQCCAAWNLAVGARKPTGEKKILFSSAGGTNYRIVLNSAIRPALKYAKCSVTAVVLLVQ
jgi:hypothetical protein